MLPIHVLPKLKNYAILALAIIAGVLFVLWKAEHQQKVQAQQDNQNLVLEVKDNTRRYQAKNGTEVLQSAVREYSKDLFKQVLDSQLTAMKDYGITARRVEQIIRSGLKIDKRFTTPGRDSVFYQIVKDSLTYDTIPILTQTFTIYKDKYNVFESVLYNDSLKTKVQVNVPLTVVLERGRRKPRLFFWKARSPDSVSVFSDNTLVSITNIKLIRKK